MCRRTLKRREETLLYAATRARPALPPSAQHSGARLGLSTTPTQFKSALSIIQKISNTPKDLYRWPAAFTLLRLGRTFQGRTSLKVAIKTWLKLTSIWKIKNKTWNSIIQMFLWPNGVVQHSWHVEPHLFRLAEAGTWGIPPHLELPGQPGLMLFVYQLFFPWEF